MKSQKQLVADGQFSKGLQSQQSIKVGENIDHTEIYAHFKDNKDLEFD